MRVLLLCLILLLLPSLGMATANWWLYPHTKSSKHYSYVGVSEGKDKLQDAMAEAYNNALVEAVKHNFGFNQKYVEAFHSTLTHSELQQEMIHTQEDIHLEGIEPGRLKVIDKKGKYLVYREISYKLSEISKEKQRLKSLSGKIQKTGKYSLAGTNRGSLLVQTKPSLAEVILTDIAGKHQIMGTSNAEFELPVGKYKMVVSHNGFQTESRDVIIGGKKQELLLLLTPLLGELNIVLKPKDAIVTIDGRAINSRFIKLKSNTQYTLQASHPDYYAKSETLFIMPKENKKVFLDLNSKPSYLSFISEPLGADIFINNQRIGKTPLKSWQVLEGRYKVRIKKKNFEEMSKTFNVSANTRHAPKVFKLKFRKEQIKVAVNRKTTYTHKSEKKQFWTFTYIPYHNDQHGSVFYLIPFGLEYSFNRRFRLGVEYMLHYKEEQMEGTSPYGQKKTYEYETTRSTTSVISRFYLFQSRYFRVGIGPDYNYQRHQRILSDSNSDTSSQTSQAAKKTQFHHRLSSFGVGSSIEFGKDEVSKKQSSPGLRIEYRRLNIKEKEDRISAGIYIHF